MFVFLCIAMYMTLMEGIMAMQKGRTLILVVNTGFDEHREDKRSSVINRAYAAHHGYDFLLINVGSTNGYQQQLQKTVPVEYNRSVSLESKVPFLWSIWAAIKHGIQNVHYDTIFYIDSNVIFNPAFLTQSLDTALRRWLAQDPSATECPFMFFSHKPYFQLPSTIAFVMNASHPLLGKLLQQWMDVEIRSKNFTNGFEQTALWKLLDRDWLKPNRLRISSDLGTPPCDDVWMCYVGNARLGIRDTTLNTALYSVLGLSETEYQSTMSQLDQHTISSDASVVTRMVDTRALILRDPTPSMAKELAQGIQRDVMVFAQDIALKVPQQYSVDSPHQSRSLPLYQRAANHQFPQTCTGKKALLLLTMQDTGLGTIIYSQLSGLIKMALERGLILVINETIDNPYFQGCSLQSNLAGHWNCMFQPISNCSLRTLTGGIDLMVENSKDVDDPHKHNIKMNVYEKHQYSAFLSRPSDYARNAVADLLRSQLVSPWDMQTEKAVGIHIRQRSHFLSKDFIRMGYRRWSGQQLLEVMLQVSNRTKINNFIVISDDAKLPRSLIPLLPTSLRVVHTIGVQHAVTSDKDCLRDNLGCDPELGIAKAAYATMIDFTLMSMAHVFAGNQKSSFSRLLSSAITFNVNRMLLRNIDGFDLDEVCLRHEKTTSDDKQCSLYVSS